MNGSADTDRVIDFWRSQPRELMVVIHCQVLDQPAQTCTIQQGDEKALRSMSL